MHPPWKLLLLFLIIIPYAVPISRADLPGTWELLLANAGIASMHIAVTRFSTVLLLCDCYAHSVLFDPIANQVRPLMILTDTWCSSRQFLLDGTLLQTGDDLDSFKKIRKFSPCKSTEFWDWHELQDAELS